MSGTQSAALLAAAEGRREGALQNLLAGNLNRAIAGFELNARQGAVSPENLADLSAAFLARFDADGDCLDLLRSLRAAERAMALEPANAAARFNRATALSLLGTKILAADAWQVVEQTETGGWRTEASEHRHESQRPPVEFEWKQTLPRLEAANASLATVTAATQRFPTQARTYGIEVVLPRWAEQMSKGEQRAAERWMRLAVAIGDAIGRSRGEWLLADAAQTARRTAERGTMAEQQALLRGLQQFGVGAARWNQQNLESAKVPLTNARDDLESANNPVCFWASFYLATCEYFADAPLGLAMLDTLLRRVHDDRYPAVVGRAEWAAGTADKVQGRVQSSVYRYRHAAECLRRAGGEPEAGFVSVLLAESYTLLGEHALAWENRRLAFHQVPFSEGPRRNVAMWTEAKEALFRQGSVELAGPLVEEAVAESDVDGRPLARASARLDRAAYRLAVHDSTGAAGDLHDARAAITQMEQGALREQMSYLALITEGLCERKNNPAHAAALLRKALAEQHATGTRFDAITYTTVLADAEIASGDIVTGAATLEKAVATFESIRATVEDPVSRMQAFRQAQPAFDRLIDLLTTQLEGNAEEPFRLAERSRARVLLELTAPDAKHVDFVTLAELEAALPRSVALASYVMLDDRIVVWIVRRGHTRRLVLPSRRSDIDDAIARFRLELRHDGGIAAIRAAAAPLYDALVRPLALRADGEALIVVPDRSLARLPFAALFDHRTQQYLIEQRPVTVAPSATLLMRNTRARRQRAASVSALIMAVSDGGTYRGTHLPALTHANAEAAAVAASYPHSLLLQGPQATKESFLRLSLSSDVVHFSGHAVVDLEAPRRSVLLFADRSGTSLAPLSLGELFDAGIGNAELVVLSACRAQDSVADDREGILGLSGAFVAAGVPAVLASPIDVADELAPPVMTAFHRRYAVRRSAGVAFQEAVLDLLHAPRAELRSPAAWGAFTVIEGSLDREDMK